jgi:hypothetical protein
MEAMIVPAILALCGLCLIAWILDDIATSLRLLSGRTKPNLTKEQAEDLTRRAA